MLEALGDSQLTSETNIDLALPKGSIQAPTDEYVIFQRRIYQMNLIITVLAVVITSIFFEPRASISLLIGAFSGIIYLRLLARSIGKLGKSSKNVGKIQLAVPVLLVLGISRFPALDLLPALLGFLLYKPALIFQFLLMRLLIFSSSLLAY